MPGRLAPTSRSLVLLGGLLLLGSLAASGCDSDFDSPSELKTLRILGIRATPAEARPGEIVTVDALVYRPDVGSPAWAEAADAQPAVPVGYEWRACFLETRLRGATSSGGQLGGDFAADSSCFDLAQVLTPEELIAELTAGGAAGGQGELPDLGSTALDLGRQPTASFPLFPLPPFAGPASFCPGLTEEERVEQGGRELWIAGMRLMISLRVTLETASGWQEVIGNHRLPFRPAADQIGPEQQGQPFRTPRLCQDPGSAASLCARNAPPPLPQLSAPNGEWSGEGPIRLAPGQKVKLQPSFPDEAELPQYVAMSSCGQQLASAELEQDGGEFVRVESRFLAWYADGGKVSRNNTILGEEIGTLESAWEAPEDPEGDGRYSLVIVARDGRGGIDWLTLPLLVVP